MFELEIIETLKPNKNIIELLNNYKYKTINGKIKVLKNTNLRFITPITYIISNPIKLTIFEYKINEISNKPYYIKEYKQKYNLKEIKKVLNSDIKN